MNISALTELIVFHKSIKSRFRTSDNFPDAHDVFHRGMVSHDVQDRFSYVRNHIRRKVEYFGILAAQRSDIFYSVFANNQSQ